MVRSYLLVGRAAFPRGFPAKSMIFNLSLTMNEDLAKARKTSLFNADAFTKLLWSPRSRESVDQLVDILQKEPLFKKTDK
jgi:hypothetical protein